MRRSAMRTGLMVFGVIYCIWMLIGFAGLYLWGKKMIARAELRRKTMVVEPTDDCLERVARYHGVLGLRIEQDGTVWFKRDGRWIQNNYIPEGCGEEGEE